MENNILKNKAKEFIKVFGKILSEVLIILFMLAVYVVPCLIFQTGYFIIPWMIFILTLYMSIWFVFLDPFRKK